MRVNFSSKERQFVLRYLGQAGVEKYLIFFIELSQEFIRCRFGHLFFGLTEPAAKQRLNGNTEGEKALAIFDHPRIISIVIVGCIVLDTVSDVTSLFWTG